MKKNEAITKIIVAKDPDGLPGTLFTPCLFTPVSDSLHMHH